MTAQNATMSVDEALEVLRRITDGVWEHAPLRRAYLAVSAMAEREAALVKEVEALRQKVEAARDLAYLWRNFERSYDRSIQDATDCSDDLLALIDAARAEARDG